MAVYKIFGSADASLYSKNPAQNTGLDEVLDVGVKNSNNPTNFFASLAPAEPQLSDDIRRALILFSDSDINKIKSFVTGSWNAYLRLYLANAENLNEIYNLEIRAVSQSWTMGTGQTEDNPETRNGVCWFSTSSFTTTASNWESGSFYLTPGGGSWSGSFATQSFVYADNKDVDANVTEIVDRWFSGSQDNNGFIVKLPDSIEQNSDSYINLSFFSVDTHTIYPPTLEMRWDDSIYETGSLSVVNDSNTIVTISNNVAEFKYGTEKYNFKINARDKYPSRVFTTSSLYTTNKALPENSYWAIQDAKTDDMVVDFDNDYTKISCDGISSYFTAYINGLEPERYYKILIKSALSNGEMVDFDNNLIFKVVK